MENHENIYMYGDRHVDEEFFPKTKEEAYKSGTEYYDRFLKPIMPAVKDAINGITEENKIEKARTECIFLDRDARPAMYAFKHYRNEQSEIDSLPIPVPTIIMTSLFEEYRHFEESYIGDVKDPSEWSALLKKRLDSFIEVYPEAKSWIQTYKETLEKSVADKDLLIVIDIGYRGSAVEIGKYVLQKAFPDKRVESLLLFKYSDSIPIRSIKSNETTWYLEAMPHRTIGYKQDENGLTYLKGDTQGSPSTEIESYFYRGIIAAAKGTE